MSRSKWGLFLIGILFITSAPIVRVHATDFPMSPLVVASLDNNGSYGSSVSETNVSSTLAYLSGTTLYGPNNPIIYSGLVASLNTTNVGQPIPEIIGNLKITVTIMDGSGTVLSGQRVGNFGMLDSPSQQRDGLRGYLTDLARWVFDRFGASVPNLQSLANGQGYTGWGFDSSGVWARWVVPSANGLMDSHGINFRYQPNFPTPGVYTVKVNTLAEVYSWLPGGSAYFPFATAISSYSFTYVYEDDANSGNDAGKDFSTATGITLGS